MDNHVIERKTVVKFLGIFLNEILPWLPHITQLCTKLSHDIALLKMASHFLSTDYSCLFALFCLNSANKYFFLSLKSFMTCAV